MIFTDKFIADDRKNDPAEEYLKMNFRKITKSAGG
jgi:hypothetical protein